MKTIGFIGGGRITRIFLHGWTKGGRSVTGIRVFDPNREVLEKLKTDFPGIQVSNDDLSSAAGSGIVFLAVHPPVMMDVLNTIRSFVTGTTVIISLAPKFTIEKIESVLGNIAGIVRMNPSACSFIQKGLNPICFPKGFDPGLKQEVRELLEPLGAMPEVQESKIEAYAMINAMGPTYFWFQIRKLKELAVSFGMDESEAEGVIARMLEGTANTLFHSGLTYDQVADLIPVKPIGQAEETIRAIYDQYLPSLFNKIKP